MEFENNGSSLKPGDTFDRFIILERIGEGNSAFVYSARDPENDDRLVAIKVAKSTEFSDHFSAEAKRVKKLKHSNISLFHEDGELPDGRKFLVFEYFQGESLRSILRKQHKLPWQEAVRIALNIVEALCHAHSRDNEGKPEIIHRDIKPENILVTPDGSAILIDFGIGQTIPEAIKLNMPFSGSIEYASPEQILGTPYGFHWQTDIYSLGIVLYEMLSGERPFPSRRASPLEEIIKSTVLTDEQRQKECIAILQGSYKPLPSQVPKALQWICKKSVEFDPQARHTPESLLRALKKCVYIKAEDSLIRLCCGFIALWFCISISAFTNTDVVLPKANVIDFSSIMIIFVLGIFVSVINGIVWYKIDETYGWEYLAGSGEHMPIGWSAVALSISVTSSLLIAPLAIPLLFPISTTTILRHLAAGFPCVVGGIVGHLAMYGFNLNVFSGFRRWIGGGDFIRAKTESGGSFKALMQDDLWRLLFQEFTYTFVYFVSIVLPYLYISRIPLPWFERFRPLQTTCSALFFFLLVSAYIVLFYPRSLNDARFVQFRGLWSAALLQIAFCAAMYL